MDPNKYMPNTSDSICRRPGTPQNKEKKKLNQLLDNIVKRILMVPQSTPRESIDMEVGILDPIH